MDFNKQPHLSEHATEGTHLVPSTSTLETTLSQTNFAQLQKQKEEIFSEIKKLTEDQRNETVIYIAEQSIEDARELMNDLKLPKEDIDLILRTLASYNKIVKNKYSNFILNYTLSVNSLSFDKKNFSYSGPKSVKINIIPQALRTQIDAYYLPFIAAKTLALPDEDVIPPYDPRTPLEQQAEYLLEQMVAHNDPNYQGVFAKLGYNSREELMSRIRSELEKNGQTLNKDKKGNIKLTGETKETENRRKFREEIWSKYDAVYDFHEGFAKVGKRRRYGRGYGVIDATGKERLQCGYDYLSDYEGVIIGKTHNNSSSYDFIQIGLGTFSYGVHDYDRIREFHEGLIAVKKNGKLGFINKERKVIVKIEFDDVGDFHDGFAKVKKYGKYGFIDTSGKLIIETQFDDAGDFHEGFAKVKKDGSYGFIDTKGNIVIKPQFDDVGNFHGGLATVAKDGKCGFITTTGEHSIEWQFDYIRGLDEGLALVAKDGKYGYIDTTGKILVELKLDDIGDFQHGFAWIEIDRKYGCIDKKGNRVTKIKYDDIYLVKDPVSGQVFALGIIGDKKEVIALPGTNEQNQDSSSLLQILNLLENSNQRKSLSTIKTYLTKHSRGAQMRAFLKKQPVRSYAAEKTVREAQKILETHPEEFLDQLTAKPLSDPEEFAKQVVNTLFPELKEKRDTGGQHGTPSGSNLSYHESQSMIGGDPIEAAKHNIELLTMNPVIDQFLSTNLFGTYANGQRHQARFAYTPLLYKTGEQSKISIPITADNIGKKISLPKPINSLVDTATIKALDTNNQPLKATLTIQDSGEIILTCPEYTTKIEYEVHYSSLTPPVTETNQKTYDQFKKVFIQKFGDQLTTPLGALPAECVIFCKSIKHLTPKQQAFAIEEFVRSVFYYDENNGQVAQEKTEKSLDTQMMICRQRALDLKKDAKKAPKLNGKLFAGVCEDCKNLTLMLCRHMGLLSGAASGLLPSAPTVGTKDAHTLVFALFPSADGHATNVLTIDGTPQETPFSRPSALELEQQTADAIQQQEKEGTHLTMFEAPEVLSSGQQEKIHHTQQVRTLLTLQELLLMRSQDEFRKGTLLEAAIQQNLAKLDEERKREFMENLDEKVKKQL